MEIQIGDRFIDEEGEWEVVSHSATLHGAKSLRARVRRLEQPATERDVTFPAHVRVEIPAGHGDPTSASRTTAPELRLLGMTLSHITESRLRCRADAVGGQANGG